MLERLPQADAASGAAERAHRAGRNPRCVCQTVSIQAQHIRVLRRAEMAVP